MRNTFLILVTALTFISCNNSDLIILIEQPKEEELGNLNLLISLNGEEIYNGSLKQTNVASNYEEIISSLESGNYKLNVVIAAETFEFDINYPIDKYIIISPYLVNDKVSVGILKQEVKFDLH